MSLHRILSGRVQDLQKEELDWVRNCSGTVVGSCISECENLTDTSDDSKAQSGYCKFCFSMKKANSELAVSATATFLLALLKRRIPLNP